MGNTNPWAATNRRASLLSLDKLQAASRKQQATSFKRQAAQGASGKRQAPSSKPQASSRKRQAQEPCVLHKVSRS
jgi:hypothetical protein